jgi:pimeloyl-ACP methyl ester carboxylesterase
MRVLMLIAALVLGGSLFGQTEDCDCPYPILFVHGWAGNETSWANMSEQLEQIGIGERIGLQRVNGNTWEGNIIYSHLNDDLDDDNAFFQTDVKFHDELDFHNYNGESNGIIAPGDAINVVIKNSCIYGVSFDVIQQDGRYYVEPAFGTTLGGLEMKVNYEDVVDGIESSDNRSNQSAPYKQGFALAQTIQKILDVTGKEKVILVGHSMGGLAIREYLQREENGIKKWWVEQSSEGHKVARVLTVGTPHRGSNAFDELDNLLPSLGALDTRSEAVRDLRYSFDSNTIPSSYLFGGNESNAESANPMPYNTDVNCNGNPVNNFDELITGLNIVGSPSWLGTSDNPLMPLPTNIKYTYYVSNINSSPFCALVVADGSDGVVLTNRQWIYNGGNGSLDGSSVPVPFIERSYLSSDVIGASAWHLEKLRPCDGLVVPFQRISETNDFNNVIRGIDEGDFPYFAFDVELNKKYAGLAQVRADRVAENSNKRIVALSDEIPSVDSDWYRFRINSTVDNIRVDFNPSEMGISAVDIFKADQVSDFSNSGSPIVSGGSIGSAIEVNSCITESGPFELGFYYNGPLQN